MSILDEIEERERSFMERFKIMPTALELDIESYASLRDELCVEPDEELMLWESYKLIIDDYTEGKRINFILSEEL